ncbi:MAG: hypothetical protein K0Q87_4552 [Neobacillus sp.]|jgi:general stress protein 26|nr:hypothetical protein [Neobacillus sp.]
MSELSLKNATEFWEKQDEGSVKMERLALIQEMEKFISSHNTCALATGAEDFVRCTPIEYTYKNDAFWLFSEGGLKFRALSKNNNVCLAIFDSFTDFNSLAGMQISGKAEMIDMWSEVYLNTLAFRKINPEVLKKSGNQLYLIKIKPTRIDYLCSEFKKLGFDVRQHIIFSAENALS